MEENVCLSCGATDQVKPLLVIQYKSSEIYICPQCLPILIHRPASLDEKLTGAENFGIPAENRH